MSQIFDVKNRLREIGAAPNKALGQNFLVSPHVVEKIVAAVKTHVSGPVIEIGPGLGALTEPLLAAGIRPRLIELDDEFAAYWKSRGLEVEHVDALKFDWSQTQETLLVSNLPYQISTHLLIERCLGPRNLQHMVLMFQKEVAQRLTAAPHSKEYGTLSVMAQLHFRIKRVVEAAPKDFYPAPKVASRVLHFQRQPFDLGEPFLRFLKGAFAFRRKFLLKNLGGVTDKANLERLPAIFSGLGLSVKARAEELTPAQFVQLFEHMNEH